MVVKMNKGGGVTQDITAVIHVSAVASVTTLNETQTIFNESLVTTEIYNSSCSWLVSSFNSIDCLHCHSLHISNTVMFTL